MRVLGEELRAGVLAAEEDAAGVDGDDGIEGGLRHKVDRRLGFGGADAGVVDHAVGGEELLSGLFCLYIYIHAAFCEGVQTHSHVQPSASPHRLFHQRLHLFSLRHVRLYEQPLLFPVSLAYDFVCGCAGLFGLECGFWSRVQVRADDETGSLGCIGEGDSAAEAGGCACHYADFVVEAGAACEGGGGGCHIRGG